MSNLVLQTYGIGDVFLIQNPEINMFQYKYYKFVNFSRKIKNIAMSSHADFDTSINISIPKSGHLLSKMYLHLKLPKMTKVDGDYLCWNDNIGMTIFSGPITFSIGGQVIDTIYPEFNDIYDCLSSFENKNKMQLTLKSDIFASAKFNATRETDIFIPFNFFFSKSYNLSLPLISMPIQEIKVDFKLRDFYKVIHYDGTIPVKPYSILESNFYVEYIDMDEVIANTLINKEHTFVIDQVQYQSEPIPDNTHVVNIPLKFNNPCKELIFTFVEESRLENNNYYAFSSSIDDGPIMKSAGLNFNGIPYLDTLTEAYYRTVFPFNVHSVIPLKYIYCIPFCLYPEQIQPSGRVNLDQIDSVNLHVNLRDNNSMCFLRIYAITHNVIVIKKGVFFMELTF
jgi:hypothetical protein